MTQTISLVEINISPEVLAALQKQQQEAMEAQKKLQESRLDPAFAGMQDDNMERRSASVTPIRRAIFDQNDPSTWAATVQRNSPCPCGSGKKYKHCHGAVS